MKVTPEGAPSVELWLDPATHLLARLVGSNGRATFVGQVQEYQTAEGVKIMRRGLQTMKAGTQVHTETQDIDTYRFEPVPPDRLMPPN